MGYFEEVYLKRMNKDGESRQDRIKSKKEKEFDKIFLKNSAYQVDVLKVNEDDRVLLGSLQPNNWNESHLIGNLLISTSEEPFQTGDILQIHQKIKDKEKDEKWLVVFIENNLIKGYQLFKVICLDSNVNFTDEYGTTQHLVPAKITSLSANMITDNFIHAHAQYGYREPQSTRILITHNFDFIKKGDFFNHEGHTYEIVGYDNISVPGVGYYTISERLLRDAEPSSSKDIEVGWDDNFFLNGR